MIFFFLSLSFGQRIREESLVKEISFRKNGVVVDSAVYPEFSSWDSNYVANFGVESSDLIEVRSVAVFSYPTLYFRINEGAWERLNNASWTRVNMDMQNNTIEILSRYFDRYHDNVNNSYQITVFTNSFQITGDFVTDQFSFAGNSTENNCSKIHNSSNGFLNFTIQTHPVGVVFARRRNYVQDDNFVSISQNASYQYNNFFGNWLENVLEVKVYNDIAVQIFFFRFHQSIPSYEISSINCMFDRPVASYDWELMPRYHPQVYNYTLVRRLPSAAYGSMRLIVDSFYVAACYLTVSQNNPISSYMWRTNTPSNRIWMSVKEDNFNLYCASLGLEYYTKNYTISYYRKSNNAAIANLTAFTNYLVPGEGYASNSSNIPSGLAYQYDLRGLNDWTEIADFKYPTQNALTYQQYSSVMIFNPIQFPLEPAGISFLFLPVDSGAYFFFSLNGDKPDCDYFFSFKSVYPLSVGNNTIILNITAEDTAVSLYNKYTIPVLSPDTSLKYIQFFISPDTNMSFAPMDLTTFLLNITAFQQEVLVLSELNNSNAVYEIIYENQIISNGSAAINESLQINPNVVYDEYIIRVFGESRNWVRNYLVKLTKIDTCGNGRKFTRSEECDDGNDQIFDGCSNCTIEDGWICSGGSLISPDICVFKNDLVNFTNNASSESNPGSQNNTVTSETITTGNTNQSSGFSNDANITQNQSNDKANSTVSQTDKPKDNPDIGNTSNEAANDNSLENNNGNENDTQLNNQSVGNTNSTDPQINSTIGECKNCTDNNSTVSSNQNDEALTKVAKIENSFSFYYYSLACIIWTIILMIGHAITKVLNFKGVRDLNIGGLAMGFCPMFFNFQLFYMISKLGIIEDTNYYKSFFWSCFSLGEAIERFEKDDMIVSGITFIIFFMFLLLFYWHKKFSKRLKYRKKITRIMNLSGFIHFFSITCPIIVFQSIQYFASLQDFSESPIRSSFALSLLIPATIFLAVLIYIYISNKDIQSNKEVYNKLEALYQGIAFSYKTLPLNTKRSEVPKNNLVKPKRKGSFDLKIPEQKPKFFSCPWKQEIQLELSVEVPEFNLAEHIEDAETEKTLKLIPATKLSSNYHIYSLVFNYSTALIMSLAKLYTQLLYLLSFLYFLKLLYFIKSRPFSRSFYNIYFSIVTFSQILAFTLVKQNTSYLLLSICLAITVSFILLNSFEIYVLIKEKPLEKERNCLAEDIHQTIQPNEVFFTDPVQTIREVPVRNCVSFELNSI